MRKKWMKWQAVLTAAMVMTVSVLGNGQIARTAVDSEKIVRAHVQVTYGQTEARKMLDLVNTFRQGSDAWAWNENNSEKITYTDLRTLQMDPILEKTAMLRAVEIALSFSHTRPDGDPCFSAYRDDVLGYSAENIAVGYASAETAFQGWLETEESYSGQGHRRNMLGSSFVSIGIAHVKYQGIDYWVQEFSNRQSGEPLTAANDSTAIEEVKVLSSYLSNLQTSPSTFSLMEGETISLEELQLSAFISGHWPNVPCSLKEDYTISSENEQVVAVEQGMLSAKSAGTAVLTLSALGLETQIVVTVSEGGTLPNVTPDPSGATQTPVETKQPDTTENPETPSESQTPEGTQNPGTTAHPEETKKPETPSGSNLSGDTQNPGKYAHSDKTAKPGKTAGNILCKKKITGVKVKQKKQSRKAVISFKQMKKADGYQITYAWNKKLTKHRKVKDTKATSLVLSGLKRKQVYYFRICAYYQDETGKKQFSGNSKIIKRKMK